MANGKTIENVLDRIPLPDNGTERLKAFYKDRDELEQDTGVSLKKLKGKLDLMQSLDAKIVALIVHISGLDAARGTPAWSKLSDDERHLFEEHTSDEQIHVHPHPDNKRHGGEVSGGIDNEITTVRGEIDTMLKKGPLADNPASARILKEYSDKLNQPGLTSKDLKIIRESLSKLQANIADFEVRNVQDIIDKIQRYNESREQKNNEGNILFYGAVIHEMYRLGYRVLFGRGNKVTVAAGSERDGAERLQSTFAGKPTVIEWLKRGMVTSTSHWTAYMNSYPSKDSATVESYISQFREGTFNGGSLDADFLASSRNGGFDIKGPDGKWITRGMNIHSIAEAAQQAAKKWKEMGYQTPMQKAGGRTVQFAEMAYNVAKFGFAVASVWKGTKALWKTIFGDEASMKAAWGEFGKTLAWTGAVWYGGEAVKKLTNDIQSTVDNPQYVESMKTLSTEKPALYESFLTIWDKVGGGVVDWDHVTADGLLGTFLDRVPAHQFKEMWEVLCTGRQGEGFLNANISDLGRALDNSYHTKSGSHVGGLREFFLDMGPWGKEVYDKFLINRKTGDATRKFLRAIADYRSVDSFDGANDAVDRDLPISTLFTKPIPKKDEVPSDFDPEIDAAKKAGKEAAEATLNLVIKTGEKGAELWTFLANGVTHSLDIPQEILASMTPNEKLWVERAFKVAAISAGAIGLTWALSFIPCVSAAGKIACFTGKGAALGLGAYFAYKLATSENGVVQTLKEGLELAKTAKDFPVTVKTKVDELMREGINPEKILEEIKKLPDYIRIPDGLRKGLEEFVYPAGGSSDIPVSGRGETPPSPKPKEKIKLPE